MGVVIVHGRCVGCKQPFQFNPHRVPSVRVKPEGPRQPICRTCVEMANPMREQNGLDPIVIQPGAYDHIDECEL